MPGLSSVLAEDTPFGPQDLLEKPVSKEDNLRMLLDLNGGVCEVVTGISLGASCSSETMNNPTYSE